MATISRRARVVAVIEDQPDVRAIVKLLVERAGFVVGHEFESAEAALEGFPDTVDAIVLDNHLAGDLTGLEAAPRLKAVAPGAVIVLFSALDLVPQATAEPSIDLVLRKDRVTQLAPMLQSLLGDPPAGRP